MTRPRNSLLDALWASILILASSLVAADATSATRVPACGVGLAPELPDARRTSVPFASESPWAAWALPITDTTVDILVAYTTMAKDGAGGMEAIEALISVMIDDTNAALVNSQVNVRLRMVHAVELKYEESGSMPTDLGRLQNPGDGFMDEVHALRNSFGADLVSLLTHTGDYLGYAYITSSEETAFSIVGWGSATAPAYVFAHEVGHNLGAGHARPIGPRGKYDYSYCYWDHGTPSGWSTIVASYGGPVIPYFSNPAVLYNGQPTGVDESDLENSADNARTISLHAPIVAAFRVATVAVPGSEDLALSRLCNLLANRPNPFRLSTLLPYELRRRNQVHMTIVDIQGRAVRKLVDVVQESGDHTAVWDGRTETGSIAPPGVYVCRLEVAGYTQSRRLTLLR